MSKVLYKSDNLSIIWQIDVNLIASNKNDIPNLRSYSLNLTINIFVNWKLKVFNLYFSLSENENKQLNISNYSNFRIFEDTLNGMWYELKEWDSCINANKFVSELVNWHDWEKFLI